MKLRFYLWVLLTCFATTCTLGQVALRNGEYFFDTDLGYGTGTGFQFPADSLASASVPVQIPPTLSLGMHNLYFRAQDDSGHWSHTVQRLLTIYALGVDSNAVVRGEYFWDTDPGFDQASDFTFSPSDSTVFQTIASQVGSLSLGLHNLYYRTRDRNSNWSHTVQRLVTVYDSTLDDTANVVVRGEYFWDFEPGFESASSFSFAAPHRLVEETIAAQVTDTLGKRKLYFRVRDINGHWSHTVWDTVNVGLVGVKNGLPSHTFSITPNPCSECLITGTANPADLTVTDLLGRNMEASFHQKGTNYAVEFTHSPGAVYLIRNRKSGEVLRFVRN